MDSLVIKRSIVINGHKTSVSLEDAFWSGLKEIAEDEDSTLSKMAAEIDALRQQNNLSSAIRLFVLGRVRDRAARFTQVVIEAKALNGGELKATR